MVEFATRADLRGFAAKIQLTEQATVQKRAESRSAINATFLSHSTKDQELVIGALRVLERHGASVYLDKKDLALPPYTSRQTAKILRDRIVQCSKFIVLASENSKDSRWVPWELGIADGAKGIEKIAIFPAVEQQDRNAWTEWEYLGLYSQIVWGRLAGYEDKLWMVWNRSANTAKALFKWLSEP
jgi:TIR domain